MPVREGCWAATGRPRGARAERPPPPKSCRGGGRGLGCRAQPIGLLFGLGGLRPQGLSTADSIWVVCIRCVFAGRCLCVHQASQDEGPHRRRCCPGVGTLVRRLSRLESVAAPSCSGPGHRAVLFTCTCESSGSRNFSCADYCFSSPPVQSIASSSLKSARVALRSARVSLSSTRMAADLGGVKQQIEQELARNAAGADPADVEEMLAILTASTRSYERKVAKAGGQPDIRHAKRSQPNPKRALYIP